MGFLRLLATTLLASALAAPHAAADGRSPGSLLFFPIHQSDLFNPTVFNVVNVTNTNRAGHGGTKVHFQYVNVSTSGSPFLFANCNVQNRIETLTPADTLSILTSCHNGATASKGYLVVSAMDPAIIDRYWSFNHLIGSEQIVTPGGGLYSLNAMPFISTLPQGFDTDLDSDGRRDFDGMEYEGIPDELYIDSFIAIISGEIILASLLDGQFLNNVDFIIYNDNEFQLSGQFAFSCWSRTRLALISGYFSANGLATTPDDIKELDTNCDGQQNYDTGWAIVRPTTALSITSGTFQNPPVLGALLDDQAPFMNARLLWETPQKQFNGQFPY